MEQTQKSLIIEAKKLGIKVDLLEDCATTNILLSKDGKDVLFSKDGTPLDQLSYQAFYVAANKQLCKSFFDKLDISHPKSMIFKDMDVSAAQITGFMEPNKSYVCKPLDGSEGIGVCMNITNKAELASAWNEWKNEYHEFMLEEQKEGSDLRIQVIGGKMVAACVREPAFVIGDGVSSLAQLVEARQAQVIKQNPVNKLELDTASFELLKKQNVSLDSVLAKGEKIRLKYVANMSQGAVSTDITEEMHADYNLWIERISKEFNWSIYALDVLTKDYTTAPTQDSAWAIEINGQPYWYHHTFSERRTHNIAKMILEHVFDSNS